MLWLLNAPPYSLGRRLQEVTHHGFWVRQAEASLAHIAGREAVLSVQLAGAAERARSVEMRMARLQGELAARQSTLAQCEDEAAQMGQVRLCAPPAWPLAARTPAVSNSSSLYLKSLIVL